VEQQSTRGKVILLSILLFGVAITTGYLQSIFHFNSYLALVVCLIDTLVCMRLLFSH
jgi:hypothetical protein